MQMSGEQTIAASRQAVWDALNDPQSLRECIPGCESITPSGENQYAVVMTAAVGPVKAKFNAKLSLSDIVPPTSYTMGFDGSGGAAGFGKGTASVALADTDGGATVLSYTVEAQVGGKIAQVGARLIDGVAKKLANEFFARFKARFEAPQAQVPAAGELAPHAAPQGGPLPPQQPVPGAAPMPWPMQPPPYYGYREPSIRPREMLAWGLALASSTIAICALIVR